MKKPDDTWKTGGPRFRASMLLHWGTGAAFGIISAFMIFLVYHQARSQALIEAETKARLILDRNLATHHYFSEHLKPKVFELTDAIRSKDYFEPSWMSSTYAVREIDKQFKRLTDANYYYKESAINARSPENEADDFERSFIKELNTNPKLQTKTVLRQFADQPYYMLLRRGETMEASCLQCHSDPAQAPSGLVSFYGPTRSFGRQLGEVVSAISIRVPLADAYAVANRLALELSAVALVLLTALFGMQFWLSRRLIFAPLTELRDAAQRIATDEKFLGQQIQPSTTHELGELTMAFNAMSGVLKRDRDQLEEHVRERTRQLARSNQALQTEIIECKQAEAEKEKLEAQNRQLQKSESLGRMARAIAHHFNNKLAAVMMNLEMARAGLPERVELAEALKSTHEAATVSKLMLTYLGQTYGKHEPLELSESCRNQMPIHRASLPQNVVLETDFPTPGPTIKADVNQVQQVLTNLLTNAGEAIGEEKGTIRLSVRTVSATDIPSTRRFPIDYQSQETNYACLEVADTGCGIAPQDIEKLCDPFYSTKFTGRGLGLPVVMGIVRTHQGLITVESKSGKGSIFRIFLPVSAEAVPKNPVSVVQTSKIAGEGTVLVVDDESSIRNAMSKAFKHLGFTVLAAVDGIEAVEVFRQHHTEIRLVLCDLTMPRMNGWETLAALRKISPGIPVILMSGYNEAQAMAGQHSELPQAFLGKPFTFEDLRDTVARVLGKSSGQTTDVSRVE
jgi:signal transduction histidine kinase/ActR/RegA family two-component response regulator